MAAGMLPSLQKRLEAEAGGGGAKLRELEALKEEYERKLATGTTMTTGMVRH